jgi:hypothetical protein
LCNRSTEGIGLHVVREASPAVDLYDGDPLAIVGFEFVIAADVDLHELEPELVTEGTHLLERALTQVTADSVIHDDADH